MSPEGDCRSFDTTQAKMHEEASRGRSRPKPS